MCCKLQHGFPNRGRLFGGRFQVYRLQQQLGRKCTVFQLNTIRIYMGDGTGNFRKFYSFFSTVFLLCLSCCLLLV